MLHSNGRGLAEATGSALAGGAMNYSDSQKEGIVTSFVCGLLGPGEIWVIYGEPNSIPTFKKGPH